MTIPEALTIAALIATLATLGVHTALTAIAFFWNEFQTRRMYKRRQKAWRQP